MFNYSGRLFTFGCSMTKYYWPTWADILGRQFSYYENWGSVGTGNQFIFNSLIEAHTTNKFNKNDTVIIMWASTSREDYYNEKHWKAVGNVYANEIDYTNGNSPKFDERGYLIRDIALIAAAKELLEKLEINYQFLLCAPLIRSCHNVIDVIAVYNDTFSVIKPSIFEIIFNSDWYSRLPGPNTNMLPNKEQLNLIIKARIAEETKRKSLRLLQDKKIKNKILTTILFIEDRLTSPRDFHPTPLEHLEYLQKVFPNLKLNESIINWVNKTNADVMSTKLIEVALDWWGDAPNAPKNRL